MAERLIAERLTREPMLSKNGRMTTSMLRWSGDMRICAVICTPPEPGLTAFCMIGAIGLFFESLAARDATLGMLEPCELVPPRIVEPMKLGLATARRSWKALRSFSCLG